MRTLGATAVLLLLATSLAAQSSPAGTRSANPHLGRKEVKHLRKVKMQALMFVPGDPVCVRSKDHTQVVGWIGEVSNQGIQVTESPKEHGHGKKPWSRHLPPPRFVPFSQIQSIRSSGAYQRYAFARGVTAGLLGPLGWWAEWMLATGRAED